MQRTYKKAGWLILYLAMTAALIIFDQFTKKMAIARLMNTSGFEIIPGVFELQYLENRGMAWGLFQGARIGFLVVSTVVLVVIVYAFVRTPAVRRYRLLRISLAGLFAGAIGNMIDRAMNGYVVDFFYFKLINFPVFNVADCYVVVSGILFVLLFLFYYKDEELSVLLPDFLQKKEKH